MMTSERKVDFDATLEAINGMTYTHDGIQGTIECAFNTINHHPTTKGRKTEQYLATRRQLGDDWSSCWVEAPTKFWQSVERRGFVRYA
jgi:hypothetical protein